VACDACVRAAREAQRQAGQNAALRRPENWTSEDFQRDPMTGLGLIGVPEHLREATLADCPDLPVELVKTVQRWAEDPEGLMLLYGPAGAGKSWCAVGAIHAAILSGTFALGRVRFVTESDYLRLLREAYDGQGTGDVSVRLLPPRHPRRVRLLVLDDVGASPLTDWGRGAIVELVIGRHADNLPTLLTSNLGLAQLAERIDPRLASRVGETGQVLGFPHRDLRLQAVRQTGESQEPS
jgi:DNA replication protein DnaC